MDLFGASSALTVPFNEGFAAGASSALYVGFAVLGLISTALSLYISYNIVMGIKDIELDREQDLNSRRLFTAWLALAVFDVLTYLSLSLPFSYLTIVSVVISFIIGIYYLYIFNITKRLFYENALEV